MAKDYTAPKVTTLGTVADLTASNGDISKRGSSNDSLTALTGLTGPNVTITPLP